MYQPFIELIISSNRLILTIFPAFLDTKVSAGWGTYQNVKYTLYKIFLKEKNKKQKLMNM